MKTDAEKLLMRITQLQKDAQHIVQNNKAKDWEDAEHPVKDISTWAKYFGYDENVELYYQGRQAGRVAYAREVLQILGRPLDQDEGGLLTYDESKKLVEENERLRGALEEIIGYDVKWGAKLGTTDGPCAAMARAALEKKDEEQ